MEIPYAIALCEFGKGTTATETARRLNAAFGPGAISDRAVQLWYKLFAHGDSYLFEPRTGGRSSVLECCSSCGSSSMKTLASPFERWQKYWEWASPPFPITCPMLGWLAQNVCMIFIIVLKYYDHIYIFISLLGVQDEPYQLWMVLLLVLFCMVFFFVILFCRRTIK